MSQLIYPTLNLFLYDLRDSLGETEADIKRNRAEFRQKLPKSPEPDELLAALARGDSPGEIEYVELLRGSPHLQSLQNLQIENSRIRFEDRRGQYPFKGFYYPVRVMGDVYGLQLDCSAEPDTKAYDASCLANLKAEIETRRNRRAATLGESWLISGQMPKGLSSPEAIARDCYQSFLPGANWERDYQGEGRLLGGSLFELWSGDPSRAGDRAFVREKCHVIIALYPDRATARAAAKFNFEWMRLLHYRHKILWAYAQGGELKQGIKEYFGTVAKCIDDIKGNSYQRVNLKRIRDTSDEAREILGQYAICLDRLEGQLRTIEVNLSNYQERKLRMEDKSKQEAKALFFIAKWQRPSDFKFLERFSEDVRQKYMLQVEKDYLSLRPGLSLLETLTSSIREVVEIDRAKRDRDLQNNIAIVGVGVGLGVGAASASASYLEVLGEVKIVKGYVDKWQLSEQQAKFLLAFDFSILAALVFVAVTKIVFGVGEWLRER